MHDFVTAIEDEYLEGKDRDLEKNNSYMKNQNTCLIFAHRGSKCNRPENTLAPFQEALRVKSDGIELDVHLSKDNQLVVIHDEKVNRTTSGKGRVRDLRLAELKQLDAGLGLIAVSGENVFLRGSYKSADKRELYRLLKH